MKKSGAQVHANVKSKSVAMIMFAYFCSKATFAILNEYCHL